MSKPRKKPTQKQQAFARAVVETGNQSEAYRRAYDAQNMSPDSIKVEACKLAQNPNVAQTVEQLQQKLAQRHEITVDKLTSMAVVAYDLALDESAPSAAVSAVLALGKLHGLIIDKKDVTTRKQDASELTDPELERIATGRGEGVAEAPPRQARSDQVH